MRASELLGLTEARVSYCKSANGGSRVARVDGQPITLRLLQNMRVRRDRRDAELAAQSELVKQMYGPRQGSDATKRPSRSRSVPRAPDRAPKPRTAPRAESTDAAQNDSGSAP